jgi:hypothetical protein
MNDKTSSATPPAPRGTDRNVVYDGPVTIRGADGKQYTVEARAFLGPDYHDIWAQAQELGLPTGNRGRVYYAFEHGEIRINERDTHRMTAHIHGPDGSESRRFVRVSDAAGQPRWVDEAKFLGPDYLAIAGQVPGLGNPTGEHDRTTFYFEHGDIRRNELDRDQMRVTVRGENGLVQKPRFVKVVREGKPEWVPKGSVNRDSFG